MPVAIRKYAVSNILNKFVVWIIVWALVKSPPAPIAGTLAVIVKNDQSKANRQKYGQ